MNALSLYNLVAPDLCACGERLDHDDEKKVGSCFFCQADASEGEKEAREARVELAEMCNVRSRHCHRRWAAV